MKSKGIFPSSGKAGPRRSFGGSAGNSSSNNKPGPGTTDYEAGMTGDRWSRQGGGQTLNQGKTGLKRGRS